MKTRLALLLALTALSGCAKNNASVRVEALCAVPDDCKFSGSTCDLVYIGQVAVDLNLTSSLELFLQVDNLLPDNSNANTFRTNTNDAFIQEYEVEYVGLGTFTGTVTGSATVPAGASQIINVDLLPAAALSTVLSVVPPGSQLDVVARLRLKGVYGDTTSFESGDYEIRGRVCNGTGCADVVPTTCTAPAVLVYCPAQGQLPTVTFCLGS
jgi:hypothetical protein